MRNYDSESRNKAKGAQSGAARQPSADKETASEAYLYYVRNPASNEVSVCSCDMVLYPGTHVVAPSRFGKDMGIIVGNVKDRSVPYQSGPSEVRGACCHIDGDRDLAASGDYDGPEPPPKYEIIKVTEIPRLPKKDECDDSACWEPRFAKPRKVRITGSVNRIDRLAGPDDMDRWYENLQREEEALDICREKIFKHNLDMKLVGAHFLLEDPKLLFFFTSDDRVDFRELVKDLVSIFRMRIELRQIGVRDESAVLGGLAVCGRDFCCHSITDKLSPVTIKMAKEQNLSLNSMKISGPCGRLLCCLAYENEFYSEEKHDYPYEGSRLKAGEDLCKVIEVNILSKRITLAAEDGRVIIIPRSAVFYSGAANRWEITPEYQEEYFSGNN